MLETKTPASVRWQALHNEDIHKMNTKILRLPAPRRNRRESITSAEIRELRRLLSQQDRVIADLILDMREMQRSIQPAPFGFDPRD